MGRFRATSPSEKRLLQTTYPHRVSCIGYANYARRRHLVASNAITMAAEPIADFMSILHLRSANWPADALSRSSDAIATPKAGNRVDLNPIGSSSTCRENEAARSDGGAQSARRARSKGPVFPSTLTAAWSRRTAADDHSRLLSDFPGPHESMKIDGGGNPLARRLPVTPGRYRGARSSRLTISWS